MVLRIFLSIVAVLVVFLLATMITTVKLVKRTIEILVIFEGTFDVSAEERKRNFPANERGEIICGKVIIV